MIVTAQPFFNELDLLEIKLETLKGVVDAHVVVEARTTFTGIPKPLYFFENRHRFREFNVIHSIVDLPEVADSPWIREDAQYKEVLAVVRALDPEIAIWVDTDECPRANSVQRFRDLGVKTATLEMDHLLFYFDRVDTTMKWRNAKIGYFDRLRGHQPWRGETHYPILADAGWHFEYFGKRDTLMEKLHGVSHAPEPGCIDMRARVSRGELPGMERTALYDFDKLPECVKQHGGRLSSQFHAT